MTVVTITRPARCKDCIYLKRGRIGKRVRHACHNKLSPHFIELRTLKDPVCDKWALTEGGEE